MQLASLALAVLGIVGCTPSDPSPPKLVPPYPGKAEKWGQPNSYDPPTYDPAKVAESDARLAPCESNDDCWMDAGFTPINRPANERGKTIDPCNNGGRAPACVDRVCVVRPHQC